MERRGNVHFGQISPKIQGEGQRREEKVIGSEGFGSDESLVQRKRLDSEETGIGFQVMILLK